MSPRTVPAMIVLAIIVAVVAYQAGVLSARHVIVPAEPPLPLTRSPARAPAPEPEPVPTLTVAEIANIPTDFAQTHAAYRLAAQADEAALLELIDDAQDFTPVSDRIALTVILMSRYTELDPEAALDFLLDNELEGRSRQIHVLFNSWSKVDPDAAIEAVRQLETDSDRSAASQAILVAYAEAGPATLTDIGARLLRAGTGTGMTGETVLRLAMTDPAAAIREAMTQTGYDTLRMTTEIGRLWAASDPEAALRFSRTIDNAAYQRRVQTGIFNVWADRDPAGMIALLDQNPGSTERSAIVDAGVLQLARRDPAAALRLVLGVDNMRAREDSLYRVFTTWAEIDPAAAATAVEGIDSTNSASLLTIVGSQYARQAPAAAIDWALAIEDESRRQMTVTQVVSSLARADPEAAVRLWQRLPDEQRSGSLPLVVMPWAQQDPDAAERWVTSLPPGPERQAGLEPLLSALQHSTEVSNYPQLVNQLDTVRERDNFSNRRITALVGAGELAAAESELAQFDLSADGYARARSAIDTARQP